MTRPHARDIYVIGSYPGAVGWWTQTAAGESLEDAAQRLADSSGSAYTVEDPDTGETVTATPID